jgi:hypothetical protein
MHCVVGVASLAWQKPRVLGISPLPRSRHTATAIGSMIYIFGGSYLTKSFNEIHILDTGMVDVVCVCVCVCVCVDTISLVGSENALAAARCQG